VYGLGAAAGRGLQMLLVPILTRVFTPASYGVLDLLGLIGSIAALLLVMGTDAALARFFYEAEDREARRTMISSSAAWRAAVCVAFALVLWIAAPCSPSRPPAPRTMRSTCGSPRYDSVHHTLSRTTLRVTFSPEVHRAEPRQHAARGGLSIRRRPGEEGRRGRASARSSRGTR
jgi:hypothetical protein